MSVLCPFPFLEHAAQPLWLAEDLLEYIHFSFLPAAVL